MIWNTALPLPSPTHIHSSRWAQPWLLLPLAVLGYFLLAWLGLQAPRVNQQISLIWPAIAWLFVLIWRFGYLYVLAALIGVMGLTQWQGLSFAASVGLACGNAFGPALGVWLLNRWHVRYQLDSPRDLLSYLFMVLAIITPITSLNGSLQLWAEGLIDASQWLSTWYSWWFGDAFSLILFSVPLLLVDRHQTQILRQASFWLLGLCMVLLTVTLFWLPQPQLNSPTFLILPLLLLLWSTYRFGMWATSVFATAFAVLAILGTLAGFGLFISANQTTDLYGLTSYLLLVSLVNYWLSFLLQSSKNSRGRIGSALEGAALSLWELDLKTGYLSFLGQAELLLGYGKGGIGGRFSKWLSLIHPDDYERVKNALVEHLKGHSPIFQAEFRLQHQAGHYVWIFNQGRVIERSVTGRAVRMVGSLADITRLKQADLEVAQLKDFYATILSKVVTGVWVSNAEHVLIYVNQGLADALEAPQHELLGRHLLRHFADASMSTLKPYYYRAQQALTPIRFESVTVPLEHGTTYFSGWLIPLVKEGQFDGMIGTLENVTQQRQFEQQMRDLAYTDQLTMLPNRAGLSERCRELFARAIQHQRELAVFYLDLDHFQHINDTMGHQTGDELLQQVAKRLQNIMHDGDVLGRLGGDEFLLIRDCSQSGELSKTASELTHSMKESFQIGERVLQISPSIGVAVFPLHGLSFSELLRVADVALYAAKDAGRNCYSLYSHKMSERLHERLQLEHGMRVGLELAQFLLHFQPVVSLATQELQNVEVLLRWQHPELGFVSPVRFIPLAEQSGFINVLGAWVLRQACLQAAAWRRQGWTIRIAVNISTIQLTQPEFLTQLTQILKETELPASQLELELTESVMAETGASRLLLQQIRNLGVKLSLDDFGTGYSSLAYLKSFQMDKLKIDRSFIKDVLVDPDDRAIIHSMVVLGHSLGMQVVAEGIEQPEQLSALQALNVDYGQGYLFAKPLAVTELEQWFRHEYRFEQDV